jgi:hypothetical protein
MTESLMRAFFRETVDGPAASEATGQSSDRTLRLRGGLVAGCAVAIGLAAYVGDPGGLIHADPALAWLLRGMAMIKGMIAFAILAAVWWRFGRRVSKPVAALYSSGSWILVGSTTLVWQLSWIPIAAILFHLAALSMLFVSWRER